MNLQQVGSPTTDTPPSVLVEDLAAVQPVNDIDQQRKSKALFSMPC
jgi:hypothetical protein